MITDTMESAPQQPTGPRPSLGVHMKCCHVYVHIYLNAAGNAFAGWCPKCARPVRIPVVKEGGSSSRIFEAG